MSAQLTAPEEMVLKVLDFDPALPCEAVDPAGRPCGERAAWVLRCKQCKRGNFVCHAHKAIVIEQSLTWGVTQCKLCGLAARRLDDVVDILPIGAAL